MASTRYLIDRNASRVVVSARSSIHDTRTRWDALSGAIEADPDDLAGGVAAAEVMVDMTRYDAGDFLKNRKIRKDLEVERHPSARFSLTRLSQVRETGPGQFSAQADGVIAWHGHEVEVSATGQGTIEGGSLSATAQLSLDVRGFGIEPPRFLMFKVENVVDVEVVLVARAAGR